MGIKSDHFEYGNFENGKRSQGDFEKLNYSDFTIFSKLKWCQNYRLDFEVRNYLIRSYHLYLVCVRVCVYVFMCVCERETH